MASEADGAVRREVAWRVFASEYNDADLSFKEGDDERAPNYVVTPSGAKVNRLFVAGVVTEVDEIRDGYYRVRLSDPTATFVIYAGQYQPEAVSFLSDLRPPEFVAVVGKARTYSPDDTDEVFTSIRPEEVNRVDEDTRDRWNLETAQHTIRRADAALAYLDGDGSAYREHRPRLHDFEPTAEHYDLDRGYLEDLRREAFQVLAELAGVDADEDALREAELDSTAGPPAGGGDGAEAGGEGGAEAAGTPSQPERAASEPTEVGDEPDPAGSTGEPEARDGAEAAGATEEPGTQDSEDAREAPETETPTGHETGTSAVPEAEGAVDPETKETTGAEPSTPAGDSLEDFDDVPSEEAEWEWDEGERERVKEEFGDEFDTAAEIDDGGGAATAEVGEDDESVGAGGVEAEDVDPSASDDTADATGAAGSSTSDDTADAAGDVDSSASGGPAEAAEAPDDADPEDVVMSIIEDRGAEDGVERSEILEAASDTVSRERAEEALEKLLLEGMCYPTDGERIKPL